MRGALAAQQLGGVGVLLLGHQARARGERVGHLAEAELGGRPEHDLPAELRQVAGAGGGGADVVEHEVAVGDRVERVLRRSRRSRARAPPTCGRSRSSPRPARRPPAAARRWPPGRSRSARGRGGTSRTRRAGGGTGRRAARAGGACSRAAASRGGARPARPAPSISSSSSARAAREWARTSRATSVATWSLRERAVCSLPPTGPTSSVRRRSTAMWMSSSAGSTRNESEATSSRTRASPRSSSARSPPSMIPARASMRAWASELSMSYGASR